MWKFHARREKNLVKLSHVTLCGSIIRTDDFEVAFHNSLIRSGIPKWWFLSFLFEMKLFVSNMRQRCQLLLWQCK